MDILLQSTDKPMRRLSTMDSGVELDVSKLDICFGGFSPTSMGDSADAQMYLEKARERARARRESLDRAAEIDRGRASEARDFNDGAGTIWHYVVLDGTDVRIESCETHSAELSIPAQLEGKPVVALAADACAFLPDVRQIICPDSVLSIGFCAFRGDENLQKAVLSARLAQFDSHWFRNCRKLEHLVLPGQVARLDSSLFDIANIRTLAIGSGTGEIMPGAFAKSRIQTVEVDPFNPYLMTDGRALYSKDGTVMVALVVPGERYAVQDGCAAIAKKGFSTFECITQVEMPDTLEVLGEFALSRTSIPSFEAPPSLRRILEKAFFNCEKLMDVHLNEGLVSIAENAFTATSIRELRLPASIEELENPVAARTDLTYAGSDATFSIAAGSEHLTLDGAGGLYRETSDGKHLVRMMDPEARTYAVEAGTVCIDDEAFANHPAIEAIDMPQGLVEIGAGAFRACHDLAHATIPDSVQRIGDEAFLDTNIASLTIPASLDRVGANAFVTYGAHHGDTKPSLHDVQVDEGNTRFYTECGMLLYRKDEGNSLVLLCTDACDIIRIPREVDEIAPYAFNNLGGIRELWLSDRIQTIGIRGLAISCLIERIHVDLTKPVDGHESVDLRFPRTDRSAQQLMLALTVPNSVDAELLFKHYDNAIVNASSFDARFEEGLDAYDQAKRITERLLDPVYMTSVNRSLADRVLKSHIEDICVEVAKHDDRRTIDALLELGYLNADNIYAVIDCVSALQDAAMTDYLLEAKRLRFQQDVFDFDL